MDTTRFLEQLAEAMHSHHPHINKLVNAQSEEVQKALQMSDASLIHNQFGNVGYLANGTQCVELQ